MHAQMVWLIESPGQVRGQLAERADARIWQPLFRERQCLSGPKPYLFLSLCCLLHGMMLLVGSGQGDMQTGLIFGQGIMWFWNGDVYCFWILAAFYLSCLDPTSSALDGSRVHQSETNPSHIDGEQATVQV